VVSCGLTVKCCRWVKVRLHVGRCYFFDFPNLFLETGVDVVVLSLIDIEKVLLLHAFGIFVDDFDLLEKSFWVHDFRVSVRYF
jgi:hypothetical protein